MKRIALILKAYKTGRVTFNLALDALLAWNASLTRAAAVAMLNKAAALGG
jgi:hypothetical protein